MAKKNFDNVKAQLTEQAKQRFTSSEGDCNDDVDNKNYRCNEVNKEEPKRQKTVYLNKSMFKLLKKASYIKDLDQSEIVAMALERYFESEKIYLENGE